MLDKLGCLTHSGQCHLSRYTLYPGKILINKEVLVLLSDLLLATCFTLGKGFVFECVLAKAHVVALVSQSGGVGKWWNV